MPESVATMEDRILRGLAKPRLYALLFRGFAVLAVVVAAVGLFGVLSYTVARRTRELAVRAVLGARPIDLVSLVLAQGFAGTVAGLVIGLAASAALARSIATLLYGVKPFDPFTYFSVCIALLVVAAAACVAPAVRAARLHPLRGLRG